jgi:hypothetical protein
MACLLQSTRSNIFKNSVERTSFDSISRHAMFGGLPVVNQTLTDPVGAVRFKIPDLSAFR